jgi:hypothetical protein
MLYEAMVFAVSQKRKRKKEGLEEGRREMKKKYILLFLFG